MHAFDIGFCIFAAILIIVGIRRGFIEEIVRLAAVIIGFICGLMFFKQGIPKLAFLSLSPQVAGIISFLCIFFACTIAIILIGKILKKIISLTMLGWIDRLGGGCVGALKAAVIGWIFVIAAVSLPVFGKSPALRESPVFSFFVKISPALKAKVLHYAQLPLLGIPTAPKEFINKFKSLGPPKDSPAVKQPIKKRPHFDDKNTL